MRGDNLKGGVQDGRQDPQMLSPIQLVAHPHPKFFGKDGDRSGERYQKGDTGSFHKVLQQTHFFFFKGNL